MVAAWTSVRTAFAPLTDGGISSHFDGRQRLPGGDFTRVNQSRRCTNASYSNPFTSGSNDQVRASFQ